MLVSNYYKIDRRECTDNVHRFFISLCPDCEVYKGHFPGTPVSPGVCNIQMVKECAEGVVGKQLLMNNLQLCRLTTLVTPIEHPQVEVVLSIEQTDDVYKLKASIGKGEDKYLDMKAELVNQD